MCRSGRMFAPTKVWRRWNTRVNVGQKYDFVFTYTFFLHDRTNLKIQNRRFAVASALAASAAVPLLMSRGHRVSAVPEVPLVVNSEAVAGAAVVRTAAAIALLRAIGAGPELDKVKASRTLRAGKGKLRGRRHRQRRGPLVVYSPEVDGKELAKGFRNIPGVETCAVDALNLLQLAPGGHLGRFIIWTSAAFKELDLVYESKKGFAMPSNIVTQSDLSRIINSSEIQTVLRAPKGTAYTKRAAVVKKNPLRNKQVMLRLNPYVKAFRQQGLGSVKEEGKPVRVPAKFVAALREM